jgi:hypothetical protein
VTIGWRPAEAGFDRKCRRAQTRAAARFSVASPLSRSGRRSPWARPGGLQAGPSLCSGTGSRSAAALQVRAASSGAPVVASRRPPPLRGGHAGFGAVGG